jgi:uncharacterized protein (TIGR03086 family)
MTGTETPTDLDPRAVLGRAFATARTVLDGVGPDQLELPTPCTEYDVRALAGHLLAMAERVGEVGRGEPLSPLEVTEVPDDGWVESWDRVTRAVAAAWADDATLERIVELPWATLPGSATLIMWGNELSVHTWDLATATGQSPDWDDTVLAAALAAMQVGLPAEGRAEAFEAMRQNLPKTTEAFTPPFAAAVEVPSAAPLIERLVAWNGRNPSWPG